MPAVKIIKFELVDDGIYFNFDPLRDVPEKCGAVTYEMVEKSQECFVSEVRVKAIGSDGFEGTEAGDTVQKRPGAVEDLKAQIKSDGVEVEWKVPRGGEHCFISYEIEYEGKVTQTYATNTIVTPIPSPCVGNVVNVYGIVHTIKGLAAEVTVYGDIGPVTALDCSTVADGVLCHWEKPKNADTCHDLQYIISYHDTNGIQTEAVDELRVTLTSDVCINGWVSVRPTQEIDEITLTGAEIEVKVKGCTRLV